MPGAMEAKPPKASIHSFVISRRKRIAAAISRAPVTIAQAASRAIKTDAARSGRRIAIRPAAKLTIPSKRNTHQRGEYRELTTPDNMANTPSAMAYAPKVRIRRRKNRLGQKNVINPKRIASTPRTTTTHQFLTKFIMSVLISHSARGLLRAHVFLHGSLHVDPVLSQLRQLFVGHFLFLQGLVENICYIVEAKLAGMRDCGSITRDLIMLHFLGCTDQASFHRAGRILRSIHHDLLAFLDQAFHAHAFLAARSNA